MATTTRTKYANKVDSNMNQHPIRVTACNNKEPPDLASRSLDLASLLSNGSDSCLPESLQTQHP
uniref:Uncharacterized protein n=1 Tax=Oryza barthii TaxID=65489 RepID=A0A0D3G201_9ORYZ